MKKAVLVQLLVFSAFTAFAQAPQGFTYQAIARDASGNPITNTLLPVRITVQSDSLGGTTFWIEEHSSVTTNNFGLLTVVLGKGIRKPGSAVAAFSDIDWKITPKFIKTEVFQGTWKNMGSSRLWSVPYSLAAADLTGAVKKLTVTGQTTNMDEALFEVKNTNGQTVFAVYNEGVRIYVDNGAAKGAKGGFAVGGFGTAKAASQPLFVVDNDSIRAYIDTNPVKGAKGGFAVGGFSQAKLPGEEYLRVTRDSSLITVKKPAKGAKGGFAVGSFDPTKGMTVSSFTSLTSDNYLIGQDAGKSLSGGLYNSFLGFEAGKNTVSGNANSFLGYQSGFSNTTGSSNLFVGNQAGYSNTTGSFNSFLGYMAGVTNTTGLNNTFLGSYAARNNNTGSSNTAVGFNAGFSNTAGNENNFIGHNSGYINSIGNRNVFIGTESGRGNMTGSDNIYSGYQSGFKSNSDNNIAIGTRAGYMFTTGSRNICIGTEAGFSSYLFSNITSDNIYIGYQSGNAGAGSEYMNTTGNGNIWIGKYAGWNIGAQWYNAYIANATPPLPTLSNTLIIDNSDHGTYIAPPLSGPDLTHYPLIFGNFTYEIYRRCVVINGVNNHGYTFFVNGSSASYGAWGISDRRDKQNINSIPDALSKVLALRGVYFDWIDTARAGAGRQMGFIAQETEKVVPEAVRNHGGKYTMSHTPITALLVEGMKEQQAKIDAISRENEALRNELEELKRTVNALAAQQGTGR